MTGQNRGAESFLTWNKDIRAIPYALVGLAALIAGVIAVILIFMRGHEEMYTVNQEVPWGLLIATYAFFALTSSGLAFIGGLAYAAGYEKYKKVSKRVVLMAFVVLLAGFTQIGMDLGHPLRLALYMIVSPNFRAPIAWMGVLYTIELILLAIELYLILKPNPTEKDRRYTVATGLLGMVFGVLAAGTLGYVFGAFSAHPLYHGIYVSAFFVISGVSAGAAMLLLALNLVHGWRVPADLEDSLTSLGRVMGICVCTMAFLYLFKILSTVNAGSQDGSYLAVTALLSGPLGWNFWVGEILFAIVLPLLLAAVTRFHDTKMLGLAGLVFLVGFFFTKYDFILAGQLPSIRGYTGYGVHPPSAFTAYTPSAGEWMVFVLGLGLFFTLYFAAEKFLDLGETEMLSPPGAAS